jgi:hypothetical protein
VPWSERWKAFCTWRKLWVIPVRLALFGPARGIAVGMLLAWCATSMLSSHFQTFAAGHLLAFFLAAMLARPVDGLERQRATA